MKALIIKRGRIKDLGDLLQIARVEGKKALKTDKVRVNPQVFAFEEDYLVVVSPWSSSDASDVGSGTEKE